jgi:hypothetical protein
MMVLRKPAYFCSPNVIGKLRTDPGKKIMTLGQLYLLITLTFVSSIAFSQKQYPDPVELKLADLKKSNVDTIITYHNNLGSKTTSGHKKGDPNCVAYYIQLVFWVKNGQLFSQRFDYCKDYPVRKLSKSPFMKLALDSTKAIQQCEIKIVEAKIINENGDTLIRELHESHPASTSFKFIIGSTIFEKHINHTDLDTKKFDDGIPNANYKPNQNCILTRLKLLVTKEM